MVCWVQVGVACLHQRSSMMWSRHLSQETGRVPRGAYFHVEPCPHLGLILCVCVSWLPAVGVRYNDTVYRDFAFPYLAPTLYDGWLHPGVEPTTGEHRA